MLVNVNIIMANSISVEPAGSDLIGSSEMESLFFLWSLLWVHWNCKLRVKASLWLKSFVFCRIYRPEIRIPTARCCPKWVWALVLVSDCRAVHSATPMWHVSWRHWMDPPVPPDAGRRLRPWSFRGHPSVAFRVATSWWRRLTRRRSSTHIFSDSAPRWWNAKLSAVAYSLYARVNKSQN